MADHFYTTDPNGELAMNSGYWLEGTACHVLPGRSSADTSFFRWVNPNTGDHFYTTDPNGELAPVSGYIPEGIACYVYSGKAESTTALFRWVNAGTGDHFYTTDPNGELAPVSGYTLEGIACYVYSTALGNSIPLFRWVNARTGDHFYTTDPNGELAPASGYTFEGIACFVPVSAPSDLREFYRWMNSNNGDHFYTIDPAGELAPTSGYTFEGVACYVYDNPAPNTVSLFRWVHPGTGDHFYTLDPHGELAPSSGYVPEGIACNVYASPQLNTVPFFRWWMPGGCQEKIIVHFKSLLAIDNIIRDFWINQFSGMAQLYMDGGISVRLGSIEDLSIIPTLQHLRNLNIGACNLGQVPTADQTALFANRNNAGGNDIVVYLVTSLIPMPFNSNTLGCASSPSGQPGCTVVQVAAGTKWLVAHEVGHVLGLLHVCQPPGTPCTPTSSDSLMFPNVGWTNPPPDISSKEFATMLKSGLSINC